MVVATSVAYRRAQLQGLLYLRFCCKSRKLNDAENLAKADF